MNRKAVIAVLIIALTLGMAGCKKKESEDTSRRDEIKAAAEQYKKELEAEKGISLDNIIEEAAAEEAVTEEAPAEIYQGNAGQTDFSLFAADYSFSSGAGGWGTEVTIYEDGHFDGYFSDSDMGDTGPGYPGGILYECEFSGQFTPLEQVDEYTYTARLERLDVVERPVSEEIIDEVKHVYSGPYGFDDPDVFEFYLPGKPVKSLSEDFIGWTSMRYEAIFPSRLLNKSFYNVGGMEGFESYQFVDEMKSTAGLPTSQPVENSDLSGRYVGDNGTALNISIYTDYSGGEEIGNYSWEENADSYIYQQPGVVLKSADGEYSLKPEYSNPYYIVIMDNSIGNIMIRLFDDKGRDIGNFRMIEPFIS